MSLMKYKTSTSGVPDTSAKEQGIFTVQDNHTFFIQPIITVEISLNLRFCIARRLVVAYPCTVDQL